MKKEDLNNELSEELILGQLKNVLDPELNIDIVRLGLIRKILIGEYFEEINQHEYIKVLITLTSPMCPFTDYIISEIENNILEMGCGDVSVDITFDPPWQCPDDLRLEMGL